MYVRRFATPRLARAAAVAAAAYAGLFAPQARATFHEWRIDEIYSNASGTVQFIEFLQPPAPEDDERFVGGRTITDSALGHSFTIPANLPAEPGGSAHFLVATPGYAALAGAPAPDYVLPADNFFSTTADTLTFATFVDNVAFTAGQLPLNGRDAIERAYGAGTFGTGVNSPTNFAGQAGSVPEPGDVAALAAVGGLLGCRRRRRAAATAE